MNKGLRKAYEITEAKIQFVSLVDKAANLRTFLLKKADDGKATFTTCGRIIKADPESHHVTGIVYELMEEDSQGNYMTEAEITKAAYWFAKNSGQVDIQHSFKPFEGGAVVESWIAKADFSIDEEQVKKGTWLMTVEVTDPEIWESIEKGDITGFSMGGVGNYSEEDVDLDTVNKQDSSEKRGLFKQLAKAFGFDVVEKGVMADLYHQRAQCTLFWEAFYALQDTLNHYDSITGRYIFETDEAKLRESLEDFGNIMTEILSGTDNIAKALAEGRPVEKAGKKMSGKNKETLSGIYESLGAFLKEFDDPQPEDGGEGAGEQDDDTKTAKDKEDKEVNKAEVQQIVDEAIAKALAGQGQNTPQTAATPATTVAKAEEGQEPAEATITPETVAKMVFEAIEKATAPKEEPVTLQQVQSMITDSVAKALDPLLKSKGLPTNLGSSTGTVEKQEEHYLHGIL